MNHINSLRDYPIFVTYFCSLVLGLYWAIAVSVKGEKKTFPPYGLAPNAMPCDDFFPTNFTGSSLPLGNGPARSASAETEKTLQIIQVKCDYFIYTLVIFIFVIILFVIFTYL